MRLAVTLVVVAACTDEVCPLQNVEPQGNLIAGVAADSIRELHVGADTIACRVCDDDAALDASTFALESRVPTKRPAFVATDTRYETGPDGTIYVYGVELTAYTPGGEVRWSRSDDVNYITATDESVYVQDDARWTAYTLDGAVRWQRDHTQGLGAPRLVPDGAGGAYFAEAYSGVTITHLGPTGQTVSTMMATAAGGYVGDPLVQLTPDGGLMLAGVYSGALTVGGQTTLAAPTSHFVARLDAAGTARWISTLTLEEIDLHHPRFLAVDGESAIVWTQYSRARIYRFAESGITGAVSIDGTSDPLVLSIVPAADEQAIVAVNGYGLNGPDALRVEGAEITLAESGTDVLLRLQL